MTKQRKKDKTLAEQIKSRAEKGSSCQFEEKINRENLVPTGSTLLNLACSDNLIGGWPLGKVINLIGDSSSGKTFLALTSLAECSREKRFDDYRLIYDDAEAALEINLKTLFGKRFSKRLEWWRLEDKKNKDRFKASDTIQDFYRNVISCIEEDRPFIYVLDSFDALTSEEEIERTKKLVRNKDQSGSYKMEKAKLASEILRVIKARLGETKSLVLIISQTRDKIGVAFGSSKTRSGGKALRFYSCHELWMAVKGHEKKTIKGKGREIGIRALVKIKKNKLTGKPRQVEFPIYYEMGIDDIGSMVDFLIEEGVWSKSGRIIKADFLDMTGTRREIIGNIEDQNLEHKLKNLVAQTWMDIEGALKKKKKKRFEE